MLMMHVLRCPLPVPILISHPRWASGQSRYIGIRPTNPTYLHSSLKSLLLYALVYLELGMSIDDDEPLHPRPAHEFYPQSMERERSKRTRNH